MENDEVNFSRDEVKARKGKHKAVPRIYLLWFGTAELIC